ncbi:MAG: alpha/beta hydrolase [Candidatus Sericytochromatia bacterium]|nr:alpha/beta hydrolase [Candidatus Sericytochromatia bacterium]
MSQPTVSGVGAPSGGILPALWSLITPPAFAVRVPTAAGLRYRDERQPGIAPLADVYLPDGNGPHPSVVLVHGGGFVIGSRTMKPMRFLATRLAEAGFAVMVFDYRMILRGGRLPESLNDVQTALSWWQSQAERFHLDQDRINMLGPSAGASLMLLAAETFPANTLRGVISVFGIYDFTFLSGRLVGLMRQLLFRSRDQALWHRHSPVTVARTDTPLLLLHGTADDLVPIGHAECLADMRRQLGLPVETVFFDGVPHAFFNDARQPAAKQGIAAILAFLHRQAA